MKEKTANANDDGIDGKYFGPDILPRSSQPVQSSDNKTQISNGIKGLRPKLRSQAFAVLIDGGEIIHTLSIGDKEVLIKGVSAGRLTGLWFCAKLFMHSRQCA